MKPTFPAQNCVQQLHCNYWILNEFDKIYFWKYQKAISKFYFQKSPNL